MKLTKLEIGISEIVPTGEYTNARPHMSITFEADNGEIDFEKAEAELTARFNAWLPSIINKAVNNQHIKEDAAANKATPSMCPIHNVPFDLSGVSKKNGRPWAGHKDEHGVMCWKKVSYA